MKNSTAKAFSSAHTVRERAEPPAPNAAPSERQLMTNVSPLRSVTTAQFSSAITADTPEVSTPKALTADHLAAIEARGLDPELLARLGVGGSAKLGGASIAIPYLEGEAQVGCKHRTLTGEKRFVQDVGSKQIFYNINCLHDETLKAHPL